jgi:hypothetical protein
MPVPSKTNVLGSGTTGVAAGAALISAKSPSLNAGGEDARMVALNVGAIISIVPSLSVMAVGLNMPVKVASVGRGLAPPMGMLLPSKDKPSGARVK